MSVQVGHPGRLDQLRLIDLRKGGGGQEKRGENPERRAFHPVPLANRGRNGKPPF
jgi:hypothetical protein